MKLFRRNMKQWQRPMILSTRSFFRLQFQQQRPETIIELAKERNVSIPSQDPSELREWFKRGCVQKSLSLYLETFSVTLSVMQEKEAL